MDIQEQINFYKGKRELPKIENFNKQYKVSRHEIFTNRSRYPDRQVVTDYYDENGVKQTSTITIPLNRIGLPYQKKIVNIATTFFCGEPIKYTNNNEDNEIYDAFIKVVEKNKMEFVDKEILTAVGRFTECAELWYHIEEENKYYGFSSAFRLKVKVLTPDIYNLYPKFDDNDDLISFAREFKKDSKNIFEVYTADKIIRYEREKDNWQLVKEVANPIGKIPVVFYKQENVEWEDVQTGIERLEQIYSYTGESNDRFAFPILVLEGEVQGQLANDKAGKVLQVSENGSASFVAPPNANESLSKEIDRLERDVHDFTATPNISFDNMKGLGNMLAGSSAEFLFLSAHLKVMDKLAIYVPAFQRRASVIKSYLQVFNTKLLGKDLDVKPIITPFVINNEAEFLRFLMEANGNKPIYSQKHTMERAGVKNPDEMMKQISEEDNYKTEIDNSKQFI
ncbi:MAG: phage portal protein [Bergeyella cardium]